MLFCYLVITDLYMYNHETKVSFITRNRQVELQIPTTDRCLSSGLQNKNEGGCLLSCLQVKFTYFGTTYGVWDGMPEYLMYTCIT